MKNAQKTFDEHAAEEAEALARQAAAGDGAAMEELFARFEGMMKKAAYQRHLHPVAEDALAQAHLSFLRAVQTYDPGHGVPFPGWAKAKVEGDLRSFFRRERNYWQREVRPATPEGEDSFWDFLEDPSDRLAQIDLRDALRAAMRILSEKQRRVLELVFFADKTVKEAAALLHISQQSAAVEKSRALRYLRRAWEKKEKEQR